jgi:hypothetical protein
VRHVTCILYHVDGNIQTIRFVKFQGKDNLKTWINVGEQY